MFNLLRADFYRIFRSASFYICSALVALFSVLGIIGLSFYFESMGWPSKMVTEFISPTNFFASTFVSMSNIPIFAVIVLSIFTVKDFSSGVIRNVISRGHNRINYYLSKFIVNVAVAIVYTVIAFIVIMVMNMIMFDLSNMKKESYIEILIAIGKYIIFLFPVIGISTMLSFLCRNTAASMIISILLLTTDIITNMLFTIIDWVVVKQMKLSETFLVSKYWPVNYLTITEKSFSDHEMIVGFVVAASWLALSLVIGLWTFKKRDIK